MSFTLWFTGLPASGKSTIAQTLHQHLQKMDIKDELIESDDIAKYYEGLLTTDISGRQMLVRNMAVCAALLNRNRIPVLATSTTPLENERSRLRGLVSSMLLVYCNVSEDVARRRDPKGLYKMADQGLIRDFPGPGGLYEPPSDADIELDTDSLDPGQCCERVISVLQKKALI